MPIRILFSYETIFLGKLTRKLTFLLADFMKDERPFAQYDIGWHKFIVESNNFKMYSKVCLAIALNTKYLITSNTCLDTMDRKKAVWMHLHPKVKT